MILQQVLAEGEQELFTPLGVAAGVDVEDDEDEAPNVLHGDGLSVQIKESSGLM